MTKNEALYRFFSSFGLSAYPTSSVPEDVTFPYLTYENVIGCFGDTASITMNLWYHTSSEKEPNAKAEEVGTAIGMGGVQIPCKEGSIWIKRGAPFSTALSDENDPQIKRRTINLEIDFM